jgi:hypothetical protein
MLNSQGGATPQNATVQPDFDADVKQWSTRAGGRRRHPSGATARLRCAGAIGAMVAGSQPAAVPSQLDFHHPSDRNRRAGSADAQLAAGNACRCADRIRSEPTPGRAPRTSDPADHLNQATGVRLALRWRAGKPSARRRFVRRRRRAAARMQVRGGRCAWLAMGWGDIGWLYVRCLDVG